MSIYYGIGTKLRDNRVFFLSSQEDPDCWVADIDEALNWESIKELPEMYEEEFIVEITGNGYGDVISWKILEGNTIN